MEFLGQRIKQGELVTPMIASANYDPARSERWPKVEAGFDLANPDWSTRLGTRGFNSLVLRVG